MRVTLIHPCIGRRAGQRLHPHLADGAAAAGAARRPDAAGRRGALLRRPDGGDPLRRADRPRRDQRRDVHRAARLPDRRRVPPPRRAGGDGRLSRHASARTRSRATPTPSWSARPKALWPRGDRRCAPRPRSQQALPPARRGRRSPARSPTARSSAASATCRSALVEAGRGCHFKCDFCAVQTVFDATPDAPADRRGRRGDRGAARASKLFFFVDDNITSNLAQAQGVLPRPDPARASAGSARPASTPPTTRSSSSCSSRSGCQGVLIGFESLDPANLRDDEQGVQHDARRLREGARATCAGTASASTAPSSSATTATRRSVFAADGRVRPRARLLHRRVQPPDAVPGHAALPPPARRRAGCSTSAWWLDERYSYNTIPFRPARHDARRGAARLRRGAARLLLLAEHPAARLSTP